MGVDFFTPMLITLLCFLTPCIFLFAERFRFFCKTPRPCLRGVVKSFGGFRYSRLKKNTCLQVDVSDVDEDEDKEKDNKPKTKKIKQIKKEWELVNDTKAIWVRSPNDVSDEEYNNFFKSLSKEFDDPLEKVRCVCACLCVCICTTRSITTSL